VPDATIRFRPVARTRHYFRDGPRSLRRLRVTRVPPTGEDRVVAVVIALALMTLGVVAFLLAPSAWVAWPVALVLGGAAPVIANRAVLYRMRRRAGPVEWVTGFFVSLPTSLMLWSLTIAFVVVLVLFGFGSWEWYAFYLPAELIYLLGVWRFTREVRAARAQAGRRA
jgi:hypothetical protein